ncbi:MAG TPA: hypothetical protein VFY45_06465 [Baekduia sp.]|nr:hypothetical protein [Baekduia sp.]
MRGRYEHAVAQIGWPQRRSLRATKEQLGLAAAGHDLLQPVGQLEADRDGASAVPGLGRRELPVDDRSAHVDASRVDIEPGVHDPQANRFGDAQARRSEQLKQRAPLRRNLRMQSCELLSRQEAPLVVLIRPPAPSMRQHDRAAYVADDQSDAGGMTQART